MNKSIAETMEELADAIDDTPEEPGRFQIMWKNRELAECVRLRIELLIKNKTLHFDIRVDFSLPQGADPDSANLYAIWASLAADKALIAQQIIQGKTWSFEEATEYFNGEEQ